jgi:VCBS repeat-containing protein
VGGTPARAGYSAGDGVHYYELPQSGDQNALLNLPTSVGPTGVGFEVYDGEVGPTTLTATGHIDFTDPDLADTHTASAAASEGAIGTLTLVRLHDTTGTGVGGQFGWTYNADSAAARAALRDAPDGTLTETFLVTIDDGHGGTVTRTVSVTLNGTGDDPQNFNIANVAPETAAITVKGTPGDDILIGSGVAENFVFAPGMGSDTIDNFVNVSKAARDTIELDHFASVPVGAAGEFTETEFAAWLQSGALVQNGNDTLIHLGDDMLLLRNVSLANLHASDFIVHAGPLA